MLTGPPRTISEAILQLFRERQELSVTEMLSLLQQRGVPCSQRGVYKDLKGLIERGVVLRSGPRYSLSLTWVLTLLRMAEDLYRTLVDERLKHSFLPEPGLKKSWRFDDLQHLDRFWLQMIFLLFEASSSRTMYAWVPCFWFDLVHYEKDLEAQEAMRVAGNRMFMILGHDSYLTRLPIKYWSKDIYQWSYAPGPFERQMSTYYDVIDDFVMTVELTPKTTREILELCATVRGPGDMGQIRRFELIKSRAPSKLTIAHDAQKARKLAGKFREFFSR